MKRLKQFYKENRIFSILMLIVIVCFLVMAFVILKYLILSNGNDVYGDRLDDVENYEVSSSLKSEIANTLKEDENVNDASLRVSVRTIYIKINFNAGVELETAQNLAITALEQLSEDLLGYYDVEFILTQDDSDEQEGFTIMGAKNVNGTNIVWNNNTPVDEDE